MLKCPTGLDQEPRPEPATGNKQLLGLQRPRLFINDKYESKLQQTTK